MTLFGKRCRMDKENTRYCVFGGKMNTTETKYWRTFKGENWRKTADVNGFILENYREYKGDDSFLEGASQKTQKVWSKCKKLLLKEMKAGLLDVDLKTVSGIDNFKPGYIDKKNEVVFGLQADKLLKRIVNPYGGIRMVEKSLGAYNKKFDQKRFNDFKEFRKSHNDAVFQAYTDEIRDARRNGLLTGLPDAYGRGRIIGDYRRVALYGIDQLIEWKKRDKDKYVDLSDEKVIRIISLIIRNDFHSM